jgi:hypothetical protein
MELRGSLFFLSDCNIEVIKSFKEVVQLKVKETSEEEQAWLVLFFAAALDGNIHELEGFLNLLLLGLAVDEDVVH